MLCWNHAAHYGVVALNAIKFAPMLPHELISSNQPTEDAEAKYAMTCWEAHHGEPFPGIAMPFGCLCY